MVKRYENIKLCDGTIVNIIVHSREGEKSPDSLYYEYNGRLISPYEQKIRNYSKPNLNFFFKRIYGGNDLMQNLIYDDNPFFNIISKDNQFGNVYHQPIILKFGENNE